MKLNSCRKQEQCDADAVLIERLKLNYYRDADVSIERLKLNYCPEQEQSR